MNTIKTINEGRKLTAYIRLTSTDIQNLDFRKPKYIEIEGNGNSYVLEKIHSYTPQTIGLYKCDLIKTVSKTVNIDLQVAPDGDDNPFIGELVKEVTLPQGKLNEIYMSEFVWMSTTEVPTGEFIETYVPVVGNNVDVFDNVTSEIENIKFV